MYRFIAWLKVLPKGCLNMIGNLEKKDIYNLYK